MPVRIRPQQHTAPPLGNTAVASVFAAYPPQVRSSMLELRELVFRTAATTEGVGLIEETLKWGEPAYTTPVTRSGSTVRMDWKKNKPAQFALYFHCQTNLVETFRSLFPHDFGFEGQRALVFQVGQPIPRDAVAFCIAAALTYHRRGRTGGAAGPDGDGG